MKKQKTNVKLTLSILEADAIMQAADQMRDELEYYDFLPKDQFKAFCKAYDTGMAKLRTAIQNAQPGN